MGKLFLAEESSAAVRDYSKRTGLPGKTPHSLTSLVKLEKELDWIRRHQVAYDNEGQKWASSASPPPYATTKE